MSAQQWQPIETAPHETPVLIVHDGDVRIGEKRTEYPSVEETFRPFDYWDDPYNDGQDWAGEVTYWMPLPAPPTEEKQNEQT